MARPPHQRDGRDNSTRRKSAHHHDSSPTTHTVTPRQQLAVRSYSRSEDG